MTSAILASGLTKTYRGARALDSVDLSVEEGAIFGFLGPNGAGKTTMLRLMTGLARPSSGGVSILGQQVHGSGGSAMREVGFLPDVPAFYDWMTAQEYLKLAGGLFGLERAALVSRTGMLLDFAGLADVTTKIGGYSRGMKQRLGLAQALINAPKLLLLDEPTSALDPIGRKEVLEMIETLRGRTTVFFSTHILGDVERVCDSVAILDRGRVLTQGPMSELKARYGKQKFIVQVADGAETLSSLIRQQEWAAQVAPGDGGRIEITVTDARRAQHEIPKLVAQQHLGLVRFEAGELDLEDVFVELVGEAKL
ncbi:MAG: ABC transporter ATP-binding protein [Pseudolysinimonas sp.]